MAKRTVINVYKTYMFRSKDPIIDKARTEFQAYAEKAGIKEVAAWKHVENVGGPKSGTLRAWFRGGTKRPQHAAINASLRAIGKELTITDIKK